MKFCIISVSKYGHTSYSRPVKRAQKVLRDFVGTKMFFWGVSQQILLKVCLLLTSLLDQVRAKWALREAACHGRPRWDEDAVGPDQTAFMTSFLGAFDGS